MCAFNSRSLERNMLPLDELRGLPTDDDKETCLEGLCYEGIEKVFWSGRWDLNPRQLAWEARTLPLSYARPVMNFNILHDYASWCNFSCVNTVSAPDA